MADIDAALHIESRSSGNAVKISKNLNPNSQTNALYTQLSDQNNAITLTPIDSAYGSTPTALPVSAKYEATPTTYTDGDATPLLANINGILRVVSETPSGADGSVSYLDDGAFSIGVDNVNTIAGIYRSVNDPVDDGDTGALLMNQNRILYNQPYDGTNLMPMMDSVSRAGYFIKTDGTNTSPTMDANTRAGFVQPTDGINDLDYVVIDSAYGATPVATPIAGKYEATPTTYTDGDATPFLTSVNGKMQTIVSANDSINSETNPIYVQTVDGTVSGIEIIDYETSASVASAGSSNHDYTVTATKTLKVKQVEVSASGALKVEIQSGPIATLTTKMVGFTSMANPVFKFDFQGLLEVPDTSTGTFRLIRTNREGSAMDVYSTIIGTEV